MNAPGPFPPGDVQAPVDTAGGPALGRRNLLIGGALLGVAGLAAARPPVARPNMLAKGEIERIIPKQVGPWSFETASGLVLPPPDQMVDQLYTDLLTRVYLAPDEPPIMLLIAYSARQDGMLQVHRPEFCYTAGGYALSEGRDHPIALASGFQLPTTAITASQTGRSEEIVYYTRMGSVFPLTWVEQRLAVLRENLAGRIPDGLLVRVSTIVPDAAIATAALDRFTRALMVAAPAKGRQLLLGAAAA